MKGVAPPALTGRCTKSACYTLQARGAKTGCTPDKPQRRACCRDPAVCESIDRSLEDGRHVVARRVLLLLGKLVAHTLHDPHLPHGTIGTMACRGMQGVVSERVWPLGAEG